MTATWPARRGDTFDDLERAGDYYYVRHGSADDDDQDENVEGEAASLWFLLPIHEGATKFDHPTRGSGIHRIAEPPWTFRECADGSIEARASIACGRHDVDPETGATPGEHFHGYLDEGNVWRSC